MTSSGVNLHTTDVMNVQITYDGTNLTMTITDATTNATFTHAWPVNLPSIVGANTALVGFTGGTGGDTAIQEIIGWTMSSNVGTVATPTFSPAGGTYTSTQTVTIADTTSGATIYYTTNGTTPTTSSTQYTTPISVSSTETLQAIAVASGYDEQRDWIGHIYDYSASGDADVQSGGGDVHLDANGDDQRHDEWRDDLLHNERHDSHDFVYEVHRRDQRCVDRND